MNPLQLFYNNEVEREAVKAFLISSLRELAGDYAVEGKPTSGIKEASECVEIAFDKLEELYSVKPVPPPTNTR